MIGTGSIPALVATAALLTSPGGESPLPSASEASDPTAAATLEATLPPVAPGGSGGDRPTAAEEELCAAGLLPGWRCSAKPRQPSGEDRRESFRKGCTEGLFPAAACERRSPQRPPLPERLTQLDELCADGLLSAGTCRRCRERILSEAESTAASPAVSTTATVSEEQPDTPASDP